MKALFILLLAFAAYLPALRAGFVWDDDIYVTRNPLVVSPGGFTRIWTDPSSWPNPYPLVFTTFRLEHRIWGLNPAGYHAVNILLHAANSILIALLLRKLRFSGAWLAGLLFAVHPVHVESVAWITERKDTLSAFFYLLSLGSWIRFLETGRKQAYSASLLFFLFAMLSKTVTCTLPVVAALLAWRMQAISESAEGGRRGRDAKGASLQSRVASLVPFFAISLLLGLATALWERYRTGATPETISLTFADRFFIAGRAPLFYAGKLLWPSNLMAVYPKWNPDPTSLTSWLPLGACLLAIPVLLLVMRRRMGDGMLYGASFFVITLMPALGFINFSTMLYSFVADHYQYLASIGVIAMAAGAAETFLKKSLVDVRLRRMAAGAVVGTLALMTWRQASHYENMETLFRANLALNPGAWIAHYNVGHALNEKENLEEAASFYSRALELRPGYAPAENGIGTVFLKQGRVSEAFGRFERALELAPGYAEATENLSSCWVELGTGEMKRNRLTEAANYFERALKTAPDNQAALFYMGTILVQQGNPARAFDLLRRAVELDPSDATALNALGAACSMLGRHDEAVAILSRALAIDPGNPQFTENLGKARERQRQARVGAR